MPSELTDPKTWFFWSGRPCSDGIQAPDPQRPGEGITILKLHGSDEEQSRNAKLILAAAHGERPGAMGVRHAALKEAAIAMCPLCREENPEQHWQQKPRPRDGRPGDWAHYRHPDGSGSLSPCGASEIHELYRLTRGDFDSFFDESSRVSGGLLSAEDRPAALERAENEIAELKNLLETKRDAMRIKFICSVLSATNAADTTDITCRLAGRRAVTIAQAALEAMP